MRCKSLVYTNQKRKRERKNMYIDYHINVYVFGCWSIRITASVEKGGERITRRTRKKIWNVVIVYKIAIWKKRELETLYRPIDSLSFHFTFFSRIFLVILSMTSAYIHLFCDHIYTKKYTNNTYFEYFFLNFFFVQSSK